MKAIVVDEPPSARLKQALATRVLLDRRNPFPVSNPATQFLTGESWKVSTSLFELGNRKGPKLLKSHHLATLLEDKTELASLYLAKNLGDAEDANEAVRYAMLDILVLLAGAQQADAIGDLRSFLHQALDAEFELCLSKSRRDVAPAPNDQTALIVLRFAPVAEPRRIRTLEEINREIIEDEPLDDEAEPLPRWHFARWNDLETYCLDRVADLARSLSGWTPAMLAKFAPDDRLWVRLDKDYENGVFAGFTIQVIHPHEATAFPDRICVVPSSLSEPFYCHRLAEAMQREVQTLWIF